jgi:predicted GNAT superfamily acetyltransferase
VESSKTGITVRPLEGGGEQSEAVRLQQEIWGFADVELIPKRLFALAPKIGGHALGAFDGTRMIGFALAIPGLKPGGLSYLHSHMVGVQEAYQNRGVGRLLKWAQHDEAVPRGVKLMEWTFDPLQLRNAFFNIERLGAVVRRYVLNQYGITSSHLQGGLPTDRCVSEWWLTDPRVEAARAGHLMHAGHMTRASDIERVIAVPAAIQEWKVSDPARARETQARISEEFQAAFEQGLTVTGFERGHDEGKYQLSRWEP